MLLLFGRLGRYKGGAELLGAFARIDDPGLWLVIAGKQIDPLAGLLAELPAAARARVVVLDRFVPDAELPQLFHASDMVVLPYRSSLTSGSAMLALSQARPVLAPALPGLAELLDDGVDALLYRPEPADGLRAALLRFLALDRCSSPRCRQAARAKAELLDWRQQRAAARRRLCPSARRPCGPSARRPPPTLPGANGACAGPGLDRASAAPGRGRCRLSRR